MADLSSALANVERAHAELAEYLRAPVITRRDKAGVIQAFEFTFEVFWKMFQKLAPAAGLEATTPRAALQAGVKMGLIASSDADTWVQMLQDRNLTSHTYREDVANEVFGRIRDSYQGSFDRSLKRLRSTSVP